MEIKRTTEIFVETNRRFVIHQPESIAKVFCPTCGEPTLTAEQAAAFFQTSCRAIYRLVEANATHFAETEAGAVMLCAAALATVLDSDANQLPAAADDEK